MSGGARARSGLVALTGAGGMLGREIVRAGRERGIELHTWDRAALDITDREAVMRAVGGKRPAIVLHAAAWTDVDGCEADPRRAFEVNARGTAHLVEACRESGARLVMVSTDYVFDGEKGEPYCEDDLPGPVNVYGWSKLAGEEVVRTLGEGGAIARTAWLYADHGRNFLRTMLRLGREREEIAVVDDQVGSPTFAGDLAERLLELALAGVWGTYHVTSAGSVSWCGFARKIFELAGMETRVRAISTEEFPRPARRPANSALADTRLAEMGLAPALQWEKTLRSCVRRIRKAAQSELKRSRDRRDWEF